jgi:hypothetical protein
MKVFLSHSTKDKQFVQALAAELEAEKIKPWLCEVDIELDANFVVCRLTFREFDMVSIGPASGLFRKAVFCSKKWLVLKPLNFDL